MAINAVLKLRVKDDKNIKLFDLAPKGVNLPILLDSMTYKCSSKDFTVDTRASGRQIIIPGVMEIENVMISLAVNLKDPNSLVVTFRGKWAITNEADVDVTVVYRKSTGNFNIIAEPSGVSVNFVPLLTRLNLPNPFGKELSFDSFLVSGLITSDSTVTLLIREDSHHKKIYLIYNKPAQGAAQKAIAADFPKVRLSSLVSKLEGADISRVPYFGSLTAPEIGFTVSKAEITELPDDTFAESELIKQITSDGSTIKKGTRAAMKLMNTTIIIQDQKFTPLPPGLTVSNLISVIPGIDFNGIPMPFDFGLLQNIAISSFTIAESKEKSVVVGVDYKKNLNFFNNLIAIRNAKITLSLSEKPTKVRVAASGIMRVGRTEFAVKLFTNKKKKYVLQATAETFPISSAMSQFQAKALPPELNSLLSKIPFLNFTIKKPRLTFPLSSKPKQIQIGGIPVVAGYNIVSTDVIILKGVSQTNIIEGFDLRSVNLANLLHSISGLVFNRIAILNQDIEAAIVISPVTLPGIRLHGKKLKDFSIVKGISIQAAMGYPANCASDAFCAVAQYLLEDSTINLRGTMQSANSFRLFAGVSQISVGSGLVIRDAGVEVNAGAQTSIGITGSIVLRNPPITLTSKIFLSTSGVVLQMTMSGCWKNAFGAKWLTICSIIGSVGMAPGVPLTSLELGGEIRLGKPQCSAPIIAKGFFGIDAITPTNNYYYVQFTGRTTLGSLLQAFCVSISLPRVLGASGFPRGFLSSYSIAGRHLPHARLNIPNGFRLKGTFNILGLVGSADITISLPKGINCYVALPPINVGKGLLKMTRSSKDSSHGPYLRSNILLLPSPKIDIAASGFLQVLGISLSSTLRITNTYYRYTISGRMLHLFHAELVLTARYGNISHASFRVRGTFKNDIFDAIENKIEGALKSSSDKATHEINKARGKVNEQHAKFNRAVRHLKSAEGQVNRAKSSFRSAEKKLRSAHDRINRVCSIRSCGRRESYTVVYLEGCSVC